MNSFDKPGLAEDRRRSRRFAGLLVLAALTVVTLDAQHGPGASPIDPLRDGVSAVLGPVETTAAAMFRPITEVPDYFGNVHDLRADNDALAHSNAELQRELAAAQANQHRNAELSGITEFSDTSGFDVVAAQVVAVGPAQSFSQTVTIDIGTADGVVPDLTVINSDGLVGRVVEATRSSATVLLIVDVKSTIGGRLGDSMELGFLDGDADLSGDGRLELSLVDHTIDPRVGDTVVTWGSHNGAPYVAGVPIGYVVGVHSSPAELTQTAEVRPYVDFSSLDVVGVVTGRSGDSSPDVAAGTSR
jgi:rod shape-determining protein MreC